MVALAEKLIGKILRNVIGSFVAHIRKLVGQSADEKRYGVRAGAACRHHGGARRVTIRAVHKHPQLGQRRYGIFSQDNERAISPQPCCHLYRSPGNEDRTADLRIYQPRPATLESHLCLCVE